MIYELSKTPVTLELRPHGDAAASLNNVKRQDKRSRVSYSAVTTQRHLRSSQWDRLEHLRTSCDGAHFEHAQIGAVALRSDKDAVEAE
uniref:Uncharacterized protein n=1 Tax=Magallana gigas TaxID=29159 RepID=K1QG91_MAGGI